MADSDGLAIVQHWEDTGYWRVIESVWDGHPVGRLWCETTVKDEALQALKGCPYPAHLEIHQRMCEERWVRP
jgi:hypothetical protein